MSGTPRTEAELLAAFADKRRRESEELQDLRDLVASVPVLGASEYPAHGVFNFGLYTTNFTVPHNSGTYIDLDAGGEVDEAYDPDGMLGTVDTEGEFDEPLLAGTYVRLPIGIWQVCVQVAWQAGTFTAGDRTTATWTPDARTEAHDPILGNPGYAYGLSAGAMFVWPANVGSMVATLPVMRAVVEASDAFSAAGEGAIFAPYVVQNSGETQTTSYVIVTGLKVGHIA